MTDTHLTLPDDWGDWSLEEKQAFLLKVKYDWKIWARPEQYQPGEDWDTLIALAGRGFGKLIRNSRIPVPITTDPTGWKMLFDLSPGDEVYAPDGQPTRVLWCSDVQTPKVAYRMHFSDGLHIDACSEHEWVTWTHRDRKQYQRYGKPKAFPGDWWNYEGKTLDCHHNVTGTYGPEVRTTQEIFDTACIGTRRDRNHCIPQTAPIVGVPVLSTVDPYVLGCWIGDGSTGSGSFTQDPNNGDREFFKEQFTAAGYVVSQHKEPKSFGLVGRLSGELRALGILHEKRVPEIYLRASTEQRLALLQGLMDTDGHIYPNGAQVEFCTVTEQHALAVLELARTLGEKPRLKTGRAMLNGKDCGPKYRVFWCPTIPCFRLPRKLACIKLDGAQALRNHHRMITSVDPVEPMPMRCIAVAHPSKMFLVGEGFIPTHNSRMGAEWVRQKAEKYPGARIALVGPTYAAVRDVQIEGDSGLLNVCPPGTIAKWNKSLGQVTFTNGSKAFSYSGNDPEKFRGPQHHYAWVDELCAMQYASETWDMMMMGMRLGAHPQTMVTTTPKPVPIIIELVKRSQQEPDAVRIVRGSTFDNAANLPASTLAALRARYEGTHLGRQELYADLILDAPGALWSRDLFEKHRIGAHDKLPDMTKIVVAIDPGLSVKTERMTETGIIVAGLGTDRRGYVLADLSEERPSPDRWAKNAVRAFHEYRADRIVAEVNNGGDLVEHTIHTVDEKVPYKKVYASRGKVTRAEPISALYEQGRISHVGFYPDLEDQMCSWTPGDSSPDRLDAVVWAFTELLLGGGIGEVYVADPRTAGRVPVL